MKIYVKGSCDPQSQKGISLAVTEGREQKVKELDQTTCNRAEYHAILLSDKLRGDVNDVIVTNNLLVYRQITRQCSINDDGLRNLCAQVNDINMCVEYEPISKNRIAKEALNRYIENRA